MIICRFLLLLEKCLLAKGFIFYHSLNYICKLYVIFQGSDVDSEEEEPEIPVKKKKEPVALYGRFAGTKDYDE